MKNMWTYIVFGFEILILGNKNSKCHLTLVPTVILQLWAFMSQTRPTEAGTVLTETLRHLGFHNRETTQKDGQSKNYWDILWSSLIEEENIFFLALRNFWTRIRPHSLDESGATCAARLLWRTDAACCKENGMEAAQRQALPAHLQPQMCWKEDTLL